MDRDAFLRLVDQADPDIVVLFLPSNELIDYAESKMKNRDMIAATDRRPSSKLLVSRHMHYYSISTVPSPGIGILTRVKRFFTAAMGEGILQPGQKVICYCDSEIELFLEINTSNIGLASLADLVGNRADLRVLEATMELASDIAREGREGHPAGALFIVGDEQKVLMNSKELVRNPFASDVGKQLNVRDEKDTKSIKEFATLDGAVVIDGRGNALSAGRYVLVRQVPAISIEEGLGGRHLAAAYITKATRGVGIVVSSTHVVRVFKDGNVIYEVKNI